MGTVSHLPRRFVKPLRSVKLLSPIGPDGKGGIVQITFTRGNQTEVFRYWLDRIPNQLGEGFLVEKQGDQRQPNEEYHVLLAKDGHSCECRGFLRYDRCKHVAGLMALKAAGKI